jgi:phage shock protein PspC (stress-responsive transcriptional regulator)
MSEHITHTPNVRRLERSSDRVLAGVCGGLGRYFELNPAFFRIGFVVLTVLGGTGLLVYLAALLVMPDEGKERSLAEQALAERRERPWPLVGLAVAGVALVVLLSRATLWPTAGAGWIVVLLVGLAVLWASRSERRRGAILRLLVALVAIVAAAAIAAVVAAFSWFDVSLGDGVGDRLYAPATAASLAPSYRLGIGDLKIDLGSLSAASRLRVDARVGVGELKVIVPRGVPVQVNAHAKLGDVHVFGRLESGRNAGLRSGTAGWTIDANVGAGQVDVVRAG